MAYIVQQPKGFINPRLLRKRRQDELHFTSSISQLRMDKNMETNFNRLNRKTIAPDAALKFKWKTI